MQGNGLFCIHGIQGGGWLCVFAIEFLQGWHSVNVVTGKILKDKETLFTFHGPCGGQIHMKDTTTNEQTVGK